MEHLSWKCLALIVVFGFCNVILAAPAGDQTSADSTYELSPLQSAEDGFVEGLDREKRKLPDAGFGAKNAILGYVFGKIDSILDAKTRLITSLDQTNIAKNKEYGIEAPKPINSLQSLLQAVISPKIAAITSKFGSLSGSSSGGAAGGFSLSGSAGTAPTGAGDSDSDDLGEDTAASGGNGGSSAGVGGLLSSFLRLSGPILSSSSQSAAGGKPVSTSSDDDSDE